MRNLVSNFAQKEDNNLKYFRAIASKKKGKILRNQHPDTEHRGIKHSARIKNLSLRQGNDRSNDS